MLIREYCEQSDFACIRKCVVALQEFERAFEPRLPEGEKMADAYLEELFDRGRRFAGQLFVAETDGRIVGFVSVLGACRVDEPCESSAPFAYVDDLIVLAECRQQGIGQLLLAHAEEYAKKCGRGSLRLRVKSRNHHAREFYRRAGYGEYELELEKWL